MVDIADIKGEYKSGTQAKADKLVRRYTARSGKLDAATSDAAQGLFVQKMSDPEVLERRRKNLLKLTETELNEAMRATGAANYRTSTAASVDRWADGIKPYLEVQEQVVKGLPPRTADPESNVVNRVLPLAKALASKKKEIG